MNHHETTAEGNSESNNITVMLPQNNTEDSFNSSSSDSTTVQPPIHDDESLWKNSTNRTNNSSDPFGILYNNATEHDIGGNETNSNNNASDSFEQGSMWYWNGTTNFWDRAGNHPYFGAADNSTTATVSSAGGPTTWEGYILGIFCLGTAMLFVLFPAWYMDRRRHLEFVGRERRESRLMRRRIRRWNRRRRRQQFYWASTGGMMVDESSMRRQGELGDGQDAPCPLTEEYILDMLVTRVIQASDLCIEDQEAGKIPCLENDVSDKTDESTINTNKDQDMKDNDDDDETSDLEEEDSSIDDEDADCCAICLHGYKVGDEICYPNPRPCSHVFHRNCLVPWLLKQNVCPCCRVQYLPSPPVETRETVPGENEPDETATWRDFVRASNQMVGPMEGDSSFRDPGGDIGVQSTLESQEETHSSEDESESSDPLETQVDVDSTALTPVEDSVVCPTACESSAETKHGTSEEVLTGEIDHDEESCDPEPVVTMARSKQEEVSLSLSICTSEEEKNHHDDASIQAADEIVGNGYSTDMDLEAQTQLATTIISSFDADEEEDARSLDCDTDHNEPSPIEQITQSQDDTSSVTNVAPCTTNKQIVRKVSSLDDESSLISA